MESFSFSFRKISQKGMRLKSTEELLNDLFTQVRDYLKDLEDKSKPVSHYFSPSELKERVGIKLPEKGDGNSLPKWIKEYLKYSVKTGSTRFYNQLFSGFSLPGFAADVITSLSNTSMYTYEAAPLATLIEKELIKKMGDLAGFKQTDGIFVTGGSNANLVALFAARNNLIPDIKKKGSYQVSPLVAFVSQDSHYSFEKAMNLMGLGIDHLIKIPTDKKGKMRVDVLEEKISHTQSAGKKPFFVGATAGTTVRGAFDSIGDIEKITKKNRLWLHVDGSWGGSVLMSKKHRYLLNGIEKADSLAWDTHKMMGVPLISSVILFNKINILRNLNDVSGTQYLFHNNEDTSFDLGQMSLQCGRKVDALKLWFAWQCWGRSGFEKRINHLFGLSQLVGQFLSQSSDYELVHEVSSLNICFRYIPKYLKNKPKGEVDKFTLAIREKLIKSGKAIVNYSTHDHQPFFRLILVNFDLTWKDLEQFFDDLEEIARGLKT